jgi:carboxylesterase
MQPNPYLKNPQSEGGPFFWQAGPTGILLCHGYTATTVEVRPLASRLHAHGYTVAGPLLPGHGTFPQDANRYTWRDWVATVETTYQQLSACCQHVVLGGVSTGAVLSLYLAAQHPEIAGLLCYAPALKLTLSRSKLILLRLLAPFLPTMQKSNTYGDDPWQGYRVNPLKGAMQLVRLQPRVRRLLPQIHQPVLILQGRLDTTVSPLASQIIYAVIASPMRALHWMDRSSHHLLLEQELDRIAEITLEFLHKIPNVEKIDHLETSSPVSPQERAHAA